MKKQLDQKIEELLNLIAKEPHPAANKIRSKLDAASRIAAAEWPDAPAEEKPAKAK